MNAFTRIVNRWVLAEEDEPNGFIQMRTPKNRMELRADFNNYDDLIRAVKAIKEEAKIMYRDKYNENDFA
ncbi:MAG: hypothetical protein VZR27_12740 [Acutalibacteraceae bacterium]|nr:hypothetical protein [Acutalibacteraceae bacterium]